MSLRRTERLEKVEEDGGIGNLTYLRCLPLQPEGSMMPTGSALALITTLPTPTSVSLEARRKLYRLRSSFRRIKVSRVNPAKSTGSA